MNLSKFYCLTLLLGIGILEKTLAFNLLHFEALQNSTVSEQFLSRKFFYGEKPCPKSMCGLSVAYIKFLEGNMKKACDSLYIEYLLDKENYCEVDKYRKNIIDPSVEQLNYLCTKDENGNYCDKNFVDFKNLNTKNYIEKKACGVNVSEKCKKAYMKFINLLYVREDNNIKKATLSFEEINYMKIVNYGITPKEKDDINKYCSVNSNFISKNGRCGFGLGKCGSNECCSKYGHCGTTAEHCYDGCQSDYGKCKNSSELKVSEDFKCGSKNGRRCMSGYCCSKSNWCGNTDEYCKKSKGCQSVFGECY